MGSRIRIEIVKGERSGKVLLFESPCAAIFGRAEDCYEQISHADLRVGRHHFLLEIAPPRCRIADLASVNGTYVNDNRILCADSKCRNGDFSSLDFTELHDEDRVSAGQTAIQVRIESIAFCAQCGGETGIWLPAKARESVVLCSTCSQQPAARPSKAPAAASNSSRLERCSKCNAPCPAPSPEDTGQDGLCEVCRARARESRERVEALVTRCLAASPRSKGGNLEDYEIRRPLPQGRTGVSYFATHRIRRKPVAIKLIRIGPIPDSASQRLLGWLEMVRDLEHPNLVQLLDFGFGDGNLVLVTEYCDLGNLAHRAGQREGPIGLSDGVPVIGDCIDALAFAHSAGIHHFNLKLENILLSGSQNDQPRAKVSDWGISEELKQVYLSACQPDADGTVPHEPPSPLTPPEILKGGGWTPKGDIWSMGAIAFFILTGRYPLPPGQATDPKNSNLVSIRKLERRIPPDLARVIDRALQLCPDDRFKNMPEMSQDMSIARRNLIRLTIAAG